MTAYPEDKQETNTKQGCNEEEELHNEEEYNINAVEKTNDKKKQKFDEQGEKTYKIEAKGESIKNKEQSI